MMSASCPSQTYEYFADRDPLTRAVMDRMLAGVSTRKFAGRRRAGRRGGRAGGASTSKSTVSELFIERTRTALGELMARRLDDVRLAVMMLDGLEIADRTHVVALGISHRGREDPARALGRQHRERDAGPIAARRPRRPRPRSRAGDPVRDRRRQGAAQGDQGRVRRARAGASLSPPQGAKCHRPAARARPAADPRPDPRRVGADRTPTSPSSGSSSSPPSSTAPGPTPPPRCARG